MLTSMMASLVVVGCLERRGGHTRAAAVAGVAGGVVLHHQITGWGHTASFVTLGRASRLSRRP